MLIIVKKLNEYEKIPAPGATGAGGATGVTTAGRPIRMSLLLTFQNK